MTENLLIKKFIKFHRWVYKLVLLL